MGVEEDFADLLDDAMSEWEEPACGAEGGDIVQADMWAWALRANERKRGQLKLVYEERAEKLKAVFAEEDRKLEANSDRLEDMLTRWLLAWNAGDEKKKSHTLPCGVKVSSTAGSIDVVPDVSAVATGEEIAAAMAKYEAWCLKNDFSKMEVKATPGEAKAAIVAASTESTKHDGRKIKTGGVAIDENGAMVPGVRLEKKPRKVKVTL